MGQGLYNMLGFGTLDPPMVEDNEGYVEIPEGVDDLPHIHSAYECEPHFLCVGLAVDEGWLQDYWKLPELPDSILRCAPRKARYAEDDLTFNVPRAARRTWTRAQALFVKSGLVLPDARLVVVSDWD